MSRNERPGVYTSYELSSGLRGSGNGGAVGLAAASETGTAGTVSVFADELSALSVFGSGSMAELVRILLENGAPAVYCCPVTDGDYDTAFAALMAEENVRFMVCDSRAATVHAKLLAAIEAADERCRYRIGVVESSVSTRAGLVSAAQALNSERMVLVSHHTDAAGAAAAAVCGVIAGESDPALPLNGTKLRGIGDPGANFSDGDLQLLISGGVLPLETLGGEVQIIRGITTRSSTAGVADASWRELNTVLILNTVLPTVRDALRGSFARAKNNVRTRGAIRTRVVIELERFLQREIIERYDNISVAQAQDDPTVCEVSFSFGVAHGLNILELSAHITV